MILKFWFHVKDLLSLYLGPKLEVRHVIVKCLQRLELRLEKKTGNFLGFMEFDTV